MLYERRPNVKPRLNLADIEGIAPPFILRFFHGWVSCLDTRLVPRRAIGQLAESVLQKLQQLGQTREVLAFAVECAFQRREPDYSALFIRLPQAEEVRSIVLVSFGQVTSSAPLSKTLLVAYASWR